MISVGVELDAYPSGWGGTILSIPPELLIREVTGLLAGWKEEIEWRYADPVPGLAR